MTWKIIIAALLLALVVTLVACTQTNTTPSTTSGTPANNPGSTNTPSTVQSPPPAIPQPPKEEGPRLVRIADILAKPETYKGQAVVVEGKILSECGSGCWFTLNDGSATIYIDLAPSNLVIPQRRGYKARVLAEVTEAKGDIYLIGKKVEF
jgi:uncharacterized protein YdeI (BOF family)